MAATKPRPGKKGHRPSFAHPKSLKRKRDEDGLEALLQRVADLDPKPAIAPTSFPDLPLSSPTLTGLGASHFKTLTAIQAKCLPISLKGADILGAAKTGSGKTLAFLVPVLENLYRKRWTEFDGLGALILSPTRELAIQIFEVLRKVGRYHTFSAGLVIGGKSLQEERERLARMNILVATPGRILQHMDQTAEFEIGNLQILVLDEADRIMDMGFKATVDAIVEHLPPERQTMLFSATQTKRVSDLARLSLKEPEFVSVDEGADSATPSTLQQNYVLTSLPQKLDTLWSFLRANLKKKILVFLSSGKQVRYVYEAFRHLQPGLPLLHLHGRQRQTARLEITTRFSASQHACLFATDVVARGLDFPAVDWVVQLDCPEDADTYIHRVGRTARYQHSGHAVLFLDPSEEEGMLEALQKKNVVVEKISVREKKMQNSVRNQLQNMCFKDPELKYLGQKAFVSYVRSVHAQKDKKIFNVKELDLEDFAASLGLPGAPKVRFVKGEDAKTKKNAPRQMLNLSSGSEAEGDEDGKKKMAEKPAVRTKYDRMFERRNMDVLADHYAKMIDDERTRTSDNNAKTADTDEDDTFLSVKRRFDAGDVALGEVTSVSSGEEADPDEGSQELQEANGNIPVHGAAKKIIHLSNNPEEALLIDSKRREKLLKSKKKLLKFKGHGSHMHFDDDDVPHEAEYYEREEEFAKQGRADDQRDAFLAAERERTKAADLEDKALAKQKRREKKEKRKARERAEEGAEEDDDEMGEQRTGVAVLAPFESDEEDNDESGAPELVQQPQQQQRKRQKKWFEDATSGDDDDEQGETAKDRKIRQKRRRGQAEDAADAGGEFEPQALEDLEALAQGLLAR